MRTVFWVLLLGNMVLFAVMQWGGLLTADELSTPVQPALHEEKIRLADMPKSAPASAPAAAPATSALPGETPRPESHSCMEWGDFSGADLKRATAVLSALQLGNALEQRQIEQNIGYWVYMPPLKDKAAVAQKIAQLKARGIEEYFVVTDEGSWQNAISLGVFKTSEAAQSFLEDLRKKDVRSAQIGERASKLKMTVFTLNRIAPATAAKITALQKDFPSSVLKDVPCARQGAH
ncbi:MAG: SPOR domain-containing protein [Gallionella sp.]|nr:SPOR domain-containing protein [Gallionella sp.]